MSDTETLTEEQLKEIEARTEAATPGPWQARFIYRIFESARRDPINLFGAQQEQDWPDCDFIANARADIPALCRSLRAAWTVLSEIEEADDHDLMCAAVYDQSKELPCDCVLSRVREVIK